MPHIHACVSMSVSNMTTMKQPEMEKSIKEQIEHGLLREISRNGIDFKIYPIDSSSLTIDYVGSLYVFTKEQLAQHDRNTIEEFCSREK